jgi:hypothetical protein
MSIKLIPDVGANATHPRDLYRLSVITYQAAWRRGEPQLQLDRLRVEMEAAHTAWRATTARTG